MTPRILSLRELNRALLARQMLLTREAIPVTAAIERLVGQQAQQASNPFVALWSRLAGFSRGDLASEIDSRAVVKATLMRGTLHLFTAADYLRFRATIQLALSASQASITGRRGEADLDIAGLLATGREFIGQQPRTFAELSEHLAGLLPDQDVAAMRYTVRTHLPMVQVPSATRWSYPASAKFTLADAWLGQSIPDAVDLPALIRRYLAAFGPASVADIQTWSGIQRLAPVVETMRDTLIVYRDEGKRELFDLPDAPLPDESTPAPLRFLPEFDNILLSHAKRTRIIADEHRPAWVVASNLRFRPTLLVDGFVGATWKTELKKGIATLAIKPFAPFPASDRAAALDEAERLVRFIEPDAKRYEVQFSP